MKDIAELEQEVSLIKNTEEIELLKKRLNTAIDERDANAILNIAHDLIDAITFESSVKDWLSGLNLRQVKDIEED